MRLVDVSLELRTPLARCRRSLLRAFGATRRLLKQSALFRMRLAQRDVLGLQGAVLLHEPAHASVHRVG